MLALPVCQCRVNALCKPCFQIGTVEASWTFNGGPGDASNYFTSGYTFNAYFMIMTRAELGSFMPEAPVGSLQPKLVLSILPERPYSLTVCGV
jgi:hypothetical protein